MNIKICGLTREEDVALATSLGAWALGFIFYPKSPRYIAPDVARQIKSGSATPAIGVFVNQVDDVLGVATEAALQGVQLHGDEDQAYVDALRDTLAPQVQIWKAQSVSDTLPPRNLNHVDKYVLDNGQGGSGQRFDWSLLNGEKLDNVLLAGGLSPDNCVEAAKTGCAGLDFNSGVESQPGIKDASKLASVFKTLRAY